MEIILDVVGAFAMRFLGSSTLSRRVGGTTRPVGRGAADELEVAVDLAGAIEVEVSLVTLGFSSLV